MQTINIHQAKTHLSRIVEDVALTKQPIIIAKAGKPRVQIVPIIDEPKKPIWGFLKYKGNINVPEDFDRFCEDEIFELFAGKESSDEQLLTSKE
ncbi:hypothetical protein A1D22_10200 [Pasteurellaceae bacterium LFhippo2]|nr:hypothetical protein [Pasteurellaceae bacterium LFhippo2]